MIILFDDNINNTKTIDGNTAYLPYAKYSHTAWNDGEVPVSIDGNGKYWVRKERDWSVNIHLPLTYFGIDPLNPSNNRYIVGVNRAGNKVDIVGDPKYYITKVAGDWELHDKNGWEHYVEDADV